MLRGFQNKNSTYTRGLGPYGALETIALLLHTVTKEEDHEPTNHLRDPSAKL